VQQELAHHRATPGLSVGEAIAELATDGESVTILYTGNTMGSLEPCGCYVGQSGGVARRATVVDAMRDAGLVPLLVDVGTWSESRGPLEDLKLATYVDSLATMGATVVAPSRRDLDLGPDRLAELLSEHAVPTVLTVAPSDPQVFPTTHVVDVGGARVTFLAASYAGLPSDDVIDELDDAIDGLDTTDLVVLMSSLPPVTEEKIAKQVDGIDLIIGHTHREENHRVKGVQLVGARGLGKTLGFVQWRPEASGADTWRHGEIHMTEDVAVDPDQQAVLASFHEAIKSTAEYQTATKRLFAHDLPERDPESAYVGADACQSCHADEHAQWANTPHAIAYNTLVQRQRHYYPECVTCHVTGFGYDTGFQIGDEDRAHLGGVQCETCHGPGRSHTASPKTDNIRREAPPSLCGQCHTQEHHPGFAAVAERLMPTVDHTQALSDIRELIVERAPLPGKVEMELFVMSMCPYGIKAEERLLPLVEEFQSEVDFSLRYIVHPAEEGSDQFTAMHGIPEMEENLRQIVIGQQQPEALFDYLLCRAKHIKQSWETCATETGVDIALVARLTGGEQAAQTLAEHYERAREAQAFASPTLLVSGREINGLMFQKPGGAGVCAP